MRGGSKHFTYLCSYRNDAVVPIADSYPGCKPDPDGLCSFDNVVSVLQKRLNEIDYEYDCFANYTAKAGVNYNGRAPKS
jgi:NADH:ubiquinone oxidoreductase subunit B-like Fe-S oxidoreductase